MKLLFEFIHRPFHCCVAGLGLTMFGGVTLRSIAAEYISGLYLSKLDHATTNLLVIINGNFGG